MFLFVGALRFVFAPFFAGGDVATCGVVGRLCCGSGRLGVNYWVGRHVAVVRGELGSLRRWFIPCSVDRRRMPPLARYERGGFVRLLGGGVWVDVGAVRGTEVGGVVARLAERWRVCGGRDVYSLARCVGVAVGSLVDVVVLLRGLFPNLVEVYSGGVSFDEFLRGFGVGGAVDAGVLWEEARRFVRGGVVVPNLGLLPRGRYVSVRSRAARYAIPPILSYADFKNAVVADVGSGFGTKGAASLRWGARHVVLLDVDEAVLRERGSGLLVDRVVADAHMLPLRDRAADVVIFWNVLNFLSDPDRAVEEVGRVARREVVFSVYNAASGRQISYGEFLEVLSRWGVPKAVRRLGNSQMQAVVRRHEDPGP
ncbi:class I SAM-dependent methyltransferase [Pyrobaculum neutrophilum]|uniref:Methyltransferase type 11 n=1 Tax=Pyrobaculum neutrophilum (strain DSM 2338 / JCM 9278 / NBRC 100436 / V24Sta) TaxID=444157 RepID=B1YE29_PYRNV|nr:class I SAM-dependent methyltransferase [Pyrobaculum neutrophilum]ACB40042.1 Methyltransferase type 11 [Pyrobaculum neutrophilum V24Sta]